MSEKSGNGFTNPQVLTAVITGVVTVATAVIGFLPSILSGSSAPSPTSEPVVLVMTATPRPVTDSPTIAPTDSPTNTTVPTDVPPTSGPSTATSVPPTPVPPTATSVPPTPVPPTSVPQEWTLVLMANGEDSLYIINQSGSAFNLASLTITGEDGGVASDQWSVSQLGSNQCYRLEKNDKAKAPDTDCEVVGMPMRFNGKERFWKNEFEAINLSYGSWIGTCSIDDVHSSGCTVKIPAQ